MEQIYDHSRLATVISASIGMLQAVYDSLMKEQFPDYSGGDQVLASAEAANDEPAHEPKWYKKMGNRRWTEREDTTLIMGMENGKTYAEIGAFVKRTPEAIRTRAKKLRLSGKLSKKIKF